MKETEEVESMIRKISDEISTVKNHVLEAKYSLSTDNYNDALNHLKQAEKASTCSYCVNKLKEFQYSLEYNKNICNINSKQCQPKKDEILQNIEDFSKKLPSIEEIRRNKASGNSNYNPVNDIWKSVETMGQSIQGMFSNMFKWQ